MGLFGRKKEDVVIPNETIDRESEDEIQSIQRERVKKELELLRKELDETSLILDSTASRLDSLRNEYYSKSTEIDSLNNELQKKRSEIRSIKTEYVRAKSEFDRINSEIASIRAEYNPNVLDSIKQEIELTRNILTELNLQREDAKFSLDHIHSQINSAKSELADLNSKIEKANSDLESVTSKNEAIKRDAAAAKKELEFIQKEIASPDQLDKTRRISLAAASVVASVNAKSLELKNEIEFLKKSLNNALQENHKLEELLGVPEDIRKVLDARNELQMLQSQQQSKKKELDQNKKELEFIQRELALLYSRNVTATLVKPVQSEYVQIKEIKEERFPEKKEYTRNKLSVLLLPLGPVAENLMRSLQTRLSQQFEELRFELAANSLSLPTQFIDTSRNQFRSPQVIDWVERNFSSSGYDRILAICDSDAYSGNLNFVMGEAQLGGAVAAVYFKTFRSKLTISDIGNDLFLQRIHKESIHELGHLFGLEHCPKNTCVMYFSNSLSDTDFKNYHMCESCNRKIQEQISC